MLKFETRHMPLGPHPPTLGSEPTITLFLRIEGVNRDSRGRECWRVKIEDLNGEVAWQSLGESNPSLQVENLAS